jgi:hypothetical protein
MTTTLEQTNNNKEQLITMAVMDTCKVQEYKPASTAMVAT